MAKYNGETPKLTEYETSYLCYYKENGIWFYSDPHVSLGRAKYLCQLQRDQGKSAVVVKEATHRTLITN